MAAKTHDVDLRHSGRQNSEKLREESSGLDRVGRVQSSASFLFSMSDLRQTAISHLR